MGKVKDPLTPVRQCHGRTPQRADPPFPQLPAPVAAAPVWDGPGWQDVIADQQAAIAEWQAAMARLRASTKALPKGPVRRRTRPR